MTTFTWKGGTGSPALASKWTTGSNWTNGTVPGSSDYVLIDSPTNSTLLNVPAGATTIGQLQQSGATATTINVSSGALTISTNGGTTSGALIQSSGTINIGSTLTIGGTLNQSGSGALVFSGTSGVLDLQGGLATGTSATVNFSDITTTGTLFWDNANTTNLSNLTLNNFFAGDTLKVTGSGYTGIVSYNSSTGVLTLGGIGSVHLTHTGNTGQRDYQTSDFAVSNSGGTITVTDTYPCFLRGTRIATLRGEVAVEDLSIGDLVVTASGGALPVKWIGTRGFITRLVNPHHRTALLPIRITAGALGEACPVRDLYVSPEHMLCLDDVLIPAEKLLNGTTITRAESVDVVQYFHIELTRHAVLYAEGAPAESFLDTGNRNMFANVLSYLELGHDLDAAPLPACLPIVTTGETLDAVRARLVERAAKLGLATTDDDNLSLRVDGIALRPASRNGDVARFAVPAGARRVGIVSRSVIPAELDPRNGDRRNLGVCISGLTLHDGSRTLELAPDHAGLTTGFHAAEATHRWTDGDALLPEDLTAAMPDGFFLDLKLVRAGLRYPAPGHAEVIPFGRPAAIRTPERLSA